MSCRSNKEVNGKLPVTGLKSVLDLIRDRLTVSTSVLNYGSLVNRLRTCKFKQMPNGLPFINVEFTSFSVLALGDTGASYCFMSELFFNKVRADWSSAREWTLEPPLVTSASCSNGTIQRLIGRFTTTIRLGEIETVCEFHVAGEQPTPVILGSDLFTKLIVIIDFKTATIIEQMPDDDDFIPFDDDVVILPIATDSDILSNVVDDVHHDEEGGST